MCVSRSYRSLSVFRDHLIQHYSCTLFELSFVYPPCLLCPSPDQHRVLMVAKSHVTHSLAFRIIGSAPLFCESGSACRCTIVFHHEVGASGRSKLSSLPSRNIPSRSCFFRIYRSTLGDSAPPFDSIIGSFQPLENPHPPLNHSSSCYPISMARPPASRRRLTSLNTWKMAGSRLRPVGQRL